MKLVGYVWGFSWFCSGVFVGEMGDGHGFSSVGSK